MYPRMYFYLKKLEHNTRIIVERCKQNGIKVVGVTKVSCGIPEIGQAMLNGGAFALGESRLENIKRIRSGCCGDPEIWLLRSPAISEISDVIEYVDVSLNTELSVLAALSKEAEKRGKKHRVVLMVEMGDFREGILPSKLPQLYQEAAKFNGIKITGIGTNLYCFQSGPPTWETFTELENLNEQLKNDFGISNLFITAGNSSALGLLKKTAVREAPLFDPSTSNHIFRIGESIFLGRDLVTGEPLAECYLDACIIEGEVIQVQPKPLVQKSGDNRIVNQAIVAIGTQELGAGSLCPIDPNVHILGASSDHLVVVIEQQNIKVGSILSFIPNYQALLGLSDSSYVSKVLV